MGSRLSYGPFLSKVMLPKSKDWSRLNDVLREISPCSSENFNFLLWYLVIWYSVKPIFDFCFYLYLHPVSVKMS